MTRDEKTKTSGRRRSLNQRGAIAIQAAVILVVLLGLVALGVEVSLVLVKHRQIQTTADEAAMAGVAALNMNASADTEAKAIAAQHGFVDGQDGTVVTVNSPPLSGPHVGDSNYVEVIITQPQAVVLSKLLRPGDFDVGGRAVAVRNPGSSGSYCLLSLDTTSGDAVIISNNVLLANPDCGLASNSASPTAIHLYNNATVSGPIWSHGGLRLNNGASTPNASIVTYGAPMDDPYASAGLPAFSGTCGSAITVNGTMAISPGCFGGWTLNNGATLNLSPGVYYVRNKLDMSNNVTINGTGGVTIVLDNNFAIVSGSKDTLNLTAPTSGVWSGLALMGWSTNSSAYTQRFWNTGKVNIIGAIYFPSQKVWFSNNVDTSASRCTQVIGKIIEFDNNVAFNYSCAGTGIRPIGPYGSKLAE